MSQLLALKDVSVGFQHGEKIVQVTNHLQLTIERGEVVCLVGESGSGKTITSLTVMRLIDYQNGKVLEGEVLLDGVNLLAQSSKELAKLRGNKIAMIFQEPMAALDPVYTIGQQLIETIVKHKQTTKKEAEAQALDLLKKVRIAEPSLRLKQYPHELSGGMLQRVMIAMAISCEPDLLIADEPTTALDVTTQAQVIELLKELKTELNMSILFITHDLGVAAQIADRMTVMYAGEMVEEGTVAELFSAPKHPYTKGLLQSIVKGDAVKGERLYSIPGSIPALDEELAGCRFHPRCPLATEKCKTDKPVWKKENGHSVLCWHAEDTQSLQFKSNQAPFKLKQTHIEPLIEVKGVKKHFSKQGGWFRSKKADVKAVDEVSFSIMKGETFGLVGESGCGKSTLGRMILQLEQPTAGEIFFQNENIHQLKGAALKKSRANRQVIFQDPQSSLNPRWKIGDIIGEPLRVQQSLKGSERRELVQTLMDKVGLNPNWYDRYPNEFSGGQRQRIGIARAISLNPAFIVADEAVSALDVSIQAQIINLLHELQAQLDLTYLFIGHGLHVVRHMSSRIGVMYLGKLVEVAPSEELFLRPAHHYTRLLIDSIPEVTTTRLQERNIISGDIPSPANPPSGCRFHTRCPFATQRCKEEEPQLQALSQDRQVACHYPMGS